MTKRRLTTHEIYQDLWQKIINFDLSPGLRVTETELAQRYDTSRTPIREAMKRLEAEGLVTVRPKQGCFIRQLDLAQISDYYAVRAALEAMTVELAIAYMSNEEIQTLADVWAPQNVKSHRNNAEYFAQFEESFHIVIAKASRNLVLLRYLEDVNNRIRPIRTLGFPDEQSVEDIYQEHHEIIHLIQQREVVRARQAMTKHILKSQAKASSVTLSQLEQYRNKRACRDTSA